MLDQNSKIMSLTLPRQMQFPRLKKYCLAINALPIYFSITIFLIHLHCNFFFRLYLSLGLTKAALEIALKLEMWETVIDCYHRIDLKHKAAEVIQNKINTNGKSFDSLKKDISNLLNPYG